MLKKDETTHCGQPTIKCRLAFNDGGKRYAVVTHCMICKQNSPHDGGGNIGNGKHLDLPWVHEINELGI